ncbi:MAG TPA: HDOD domain-containing protein [Gallionellaceae bacterium]|nr:HDOD domain-containing protein [Gallionellaceae bacterium]HQS76611.1 HDOD domain-containing protein [Gallionellaceae bacterium]
MKKEITELVQGVGDLVTLPDVFIRINQLVESPNSSAVDIAQAVSQDPAFTVRLLRVANSPYYGFSSSIDTVAKAVSIIGTSQIRNLALSTAIASSFSGLSNKLVSMDNFWRHSLYCGLAARKLAVLAGKCDAEAVFTAGLLHDIGELVIFNRLPQQAQASLLQVLDSADELPLYQAEQQTMGFDHAQLGGELARQWKLPPMLEECIEYHHDIQSARRYPRETALVHIANILAQMAEVQTLDRDDVAPINPQAWEITGLSAADVIETTVRETQAEIAEAEALFFGKAFSS